MNTSDLIDFLAAQIGPKNPFLLEMARGIVRTVQHHEALAARKVRKRQVALTPEQVIGRQRAVWLARVNGRTYRQIAADWGIDISRARQIAARTERHIQRALETYNGPADHIAEGIWHCYTPEGRIVPNVPSGWSRTPSRELHGPLHLPAARSLLAGVAIVEAAATSLTQTAGWAA